MVSPREPALDPLLSGPPTADARPQPSRWSELRLLAAGPIIAAFTVIAALIACDRAGVSFRDPDHVAALYILEVGAGVALMIAIDIYIRAARRNGTRRPTRTMLGAIRGERWTASRLAAVASSIVAFYVTYLAYRNLKSLPPLLRPDVLFDSQLADVDRFLFFGNDPAALLHALFGTGVAAHVFSTLYAAFIVFLPLSLGVALVFAERIQFSLFYAAALCVNWVLGAATYFMLPSLGPVYSDPDAFSELPRTLVTHLQEMLMDDRVAFLADPATGTPQAIAAFASLHIAMSFSAVLVAHWLDVGRRFKQILWAWLVLTILATVYLGWHFVVDDIAGIAMGAAALYIARWITGFDPRAARAAGGAPAGAAGTGP